MKENFGLKQALWSSGGKKCANEKCERMLVQSKEFYWDSNTDLDYCMQCGQCLRYKRKKAFERGENINNIDIN